MKVAPSARAKVNVKPERGYYDRQTIYEILDASFVCHVGFVIDRKPFVIPVVYGRKDDKIFFHGGKGSRMLKTVKKGEDLCITVTLLDGLVLARSAFHHSVNYRSVVAFGRAVEIENKEEKLEALKTIINHLLPGRWEEVRKPVDKELNATTVLSLGLDEASAKMRSAPAADDDNDLNFPVWAGIIPLNMMPLAPVPDEHLEQNISVPGYVNDFVEQHKNQSVNFDK